MNIEGLIFAAIALVLYASTMIWGICQLVKQVRNMTKCEMECPEEAEEVDGNACDICGACEDDGTNT